MAGVRPGPDTREHVPIQAVENPILCSPYEEPGRHWYYDTRTGDASIRAGRREASYWYKSERTGSRQLSLLAEEEREDLPLVNWLRDDVARWRKSAYRGATTATKELLAHWTRPERSRRLFFCQREAVETLIFLAEIVLDQEPNRAGRYACGFSPKCVAEELHRYKWTLPEDSTDWPMNDPRRRYSWPLEALLDSPAQGGPALRRLGAKMATGSGKTLVMAMLVSWALINHGIEPNDPRFPSAVLVVGPNLTVRERLGVLMPESAENYYQKFDLLPSKFRSLLRPGHVLITNWHKLAAEGEHVEGGKSYTVVNKGAESDEAFARRVLGGLYDAGTLMVLNDEAHHAWRPPPAEEEVSGEAKEELDEAKVWIQGLDRLNRGRGVRFCADLSATPFYIQGSGHAEGAPFPWLISDFGLVDAIESGIVKIPRLPVSDTTGRPEAKYFRLWHNIIDKLGPADRLPGKAGRPKPGAIWRDAQDALNTLAAQWKARFEQVQDAGQDRIPPVLIVVCDNTDIARLFYEKISGETVEEYVEDDNGKPKKKSRTLYGNSAVFEEFANTANMRRTLRIDSKLLAQAESDDAEATRDEAAQQLRRIVDTVGRPGEPGEHIRCVVSVSMLTEGWDANNVTHILGLRAFGSQLLCEQVVGRGLRRMDYEPDPATGLLRAEYVDVYGIPFSVIPFKGRKGTAPEPDDKPVTTVRAREERAHLEITFPVVEGYVFALSRNLIRCDVDQVSLLRLTPEQTPTGVFVKPTVGYQVGPPSSHGPGQTELQDRQEYYESTHIQTIKFEIARRVLVALTAAAEAGQRGLPHAARHQLFPQVYRIVEQFVDRRVDWNGVADHRELGLERYVLGVVSRLVEAIQPDIQGGEPPLVPLLNRFQPRATTAGVNFKTARRCFDTTKSHIDHVVADSPVWESTAAFYLEASEVVGRYAKNDHLDFVIPYEFMGTPHQYVPDFLVCLIDGTTLILEIKGAEDEQDRQKYEAAKRWCEAVNNWGEQGTWRFRVCRNPNLLPEMLENLVRDCSPDRLAAGKLLAVARARAPAEVTLTDAWEVARKLDLPRDAVLLGLHRLSRPDAGELRQRFLNAESNFEEVAADEVTATMRRFRVGTPDEDPAWQEWGRTIKVVWTLATESGYSGRNT